MKSQEHNKRSHIFENDVLLLPASVNLDFRMKKKISFKNQLLNILSYIISLDLMRPFYAFQEFFNFAFQVLRNNFFGGKILAL